MKRRTVQMGWLIGALILAAALLVPVLAQAPGDKAKPADRAQAFQEMLDQSMKEKKGVTLYVGGQTVGGGVVRMVGNDAVELRSQEYSRILVRLDKIDAMAMH
jgi:hypothetical protein